MLTLRLTWKLFRNAFRTQRKRMILTVMAITWGTISIVLLLSFGEGLKRNISKSNRGIGEGIAIIWAAETGKAFAGFPAGRNLRFLPEDVDLVLASVPEIDAACGEMRTWRLLTHGRASLNKAIIGTQPSFGELRHHFPRSGGRFLNELDQKLKRRVIFLGNELAEQLFGDETPEGKTVDVAGTPFTVVGVLQEKLQMGTYGGPDKLHGVIPLSTFQALFGRRYLSNIVMKPTSPELMETAKRRFHEVLGGKYRFDPTDERALPIWDTLKGQEITRNMMIGIEIFLGIIGGLTLLIGGVGVANIMYAVVKERTKEIGVQMALGARRSFVMGPFVVEALLLTSLGGLLGIAVGVGLIQGLAWLQANSQSEAMEFLGRPTFSFPLALTTVGLLGAIGLLSGYFPSRRAASVQPAETLRYE
jgi:putative ABC transport system permease protein